jgi:hypothetical protein
MSVKIKAKPARNTAPANGAKWVATDGEALALRRKHAEDELLTALPLAQNVELRSLAEQTIAFAACCAEQLNKRRLRA